jgi:transketolase
MAQKDYQPKFFNETVRPLQLNEIALTATMLAVEAVEEANSGHPGLPMGAGLFATTLWCNALRFNPSDPLWLNRDRFVLSAGHGSALLYSLLHLFGYGVSLEDLRAFRKFGSITPGHPEFKVTPGVEATTGPLGQGVANSVGMALAGKLLSARFGEDLFNYRVYALVSDGDLMEGIAYEACSIAGHLKLDNLVFLYDDNLVSLAGPTSVCFSEDIGARFISQGWHTASADGHDISCINSSLQGIQSGAPTLIKLRTEIGRGSPSKAGLSDAHGSPLGKEELILTKAALGWQGASPFSVTDEVTKECARIIAEKEREYNTWNDYYQKDPKRVEEVEHFFKREIPHSLAEELLSFTAKKADATRNLSGEVIQLISKSLPNFVGGAADLETSTKTVIKGSPDITSTNFTGKNIRFGVREHAMGGIVNGLSYGGGFIPFSATFLVFADYMRASIRLAALSHLQSIFIFTHDSFWVGEDGPTHEPIEQLASLRAIPNLQVLRPADAVEVGALYLLALESKERPSAIILTRQNCPLLNRPANFDVRREIIEQGGYVLIEGGAKPTITLIATGSEVGVAAQVAALCEKDGVSLRVVSLPYVERFLDLKSDIQEKILGSGSIRVSIEAGATFGWDRLIKDHNLRIGIDHFGASAPGEVLADKFGFTPIKIKERLSPLYG